MFNWSTIPLAATQVPSIEEAGWRRLLVGWNSKLLEICFISNVTQLGRVTIVPAPNTDLI